MTWIFILVLFRNDVSPQLPPLHREPRIQKESANKGRKRTRRVFDDLLQLPICIDNLETDKKQMRCPDARSDCVEKTDILRDLKMKFFDKPTKALKTLEPRYMKETPAMMVGIQRVKRTKKKEANDRKMVDDFLNSINRQPQEEDNTHAMDVDRPRPCNEK